MFMLRLHFLDEIARLEMYRIDPMKTNLEPGWSFLAVEQAAIRAARIRQSAFEELFSGTRPTERRRAAFVELCGEVDAQMATTKMGWTDEPIPQRMAQALYALVAVSPLRDARDRSIELLFHQVVTREAQAALEAQRPRTPRRVA